MGQGASREWAVEPLGSGRMLPRPPGEGLINGAHVYRFDPCITGTTPYNLIDPMDVSMQQGTFPFFDLLQWHDVPNPQEAD
jgi:hypothetical protein